jgi:hypothetical protein
MALKPSDLFGVPLNWDRHTEADIETLCDNLLEHLNVARPETVTAESHAEFMRWAVPLMEHTPPEVVHAVNLFQEQEFSWPWSASPEEQHESLPGSAYLTFISMREASTDKDYLSQWDLLLDIMEDYCEWASR